MKKRILFAGLASTLLLACSKTESEAAKPEADPAPAETTETPEPKPAAVPMESPTGYLVTVDGQEDERGYIRIRRGAEEEKDGSVVILLTAENVQALNVRGRGPGFDSFHDFLGDDEVKLEFSNTSEDPYTVTVYERAEEGDGWNPEAVWTGTQARKTIDEATEWSLDTWRSDEIMSPGIDLRLFEYRHGDLLFGFQLAGKITDVARIE